ncbi:MAG: ATP-grasp ribosomal peptide maturase [Flavobacterium sp.]|nr:ATP-grasp ribosomal peptide maturase [Flavobacterium sp.]
MILCITHSNDFYAIDIVIKKLKELGQEVIRFNSDDFSYKIHFEYCNFSNQQVLRITTPDFDITSDQIKAVWYRKLWTINIPENLEEAYKKIYYQEYTTMRTIFFDSLKKAFWINPISIDHEIGENKFHQLQLASSSGLQIPKSIFTNNPKAVMHFFHSIPNKQMIAKLHGSLSRSMSGNTPFFPTTVIQEEDLENLDTLQYCPMIFQERIDKQYELRIIYVDGTFFTGLINAQDSLKGVDDWRAANDIFPKWQLYSLPKNICDSLTKMMKEMNLYFGAIDMIRNKAGEYIFLEVNPQGEWGMLQRDLGYPIGETIGEKIALHQPT